MSLQIIALHAAIQQLKAVSREHRDNMLLDYFRELLKECYL
jgi:hypothetical protein